MTTIWRDLSTVKTLLDELWLELRIKNNVQEGLGQRRMDGINDGKKACNSDMILLDLNRLIKEADLLKQAAEILEGSDSNVSAVLYEIMVQVKEVKEGLQALKILVGKQEAQLETCKELLATIHHINEVTQHVENNLPARYLYSTANEAGPTNSLEEKTEYHSPSPGSWIAVSPCYSAPFSNKRVAQSPRPYITYLKIEEFDGIPKYLRGRLTYEMVNKFIDAFNKALEKKYQLFSHPRSALKGKKLAEYDAFKKQETKETIEKGLYFCVGDDLKTLGNITMDKASYNMLHILRNVRRVREIRTPGIIRYAVSN